MQLTLSLVIRPYAVYSYPLFGPISLQSLGNNTTLVSKVVAEGKRTYKARLLISAENAMEAGEKIEKLRAVVNREGFDVLIDDVTELV